MLIVGSTNPITSQVTLSAAVHDRFGSPLGGVGVTFQVTGANPVTATVTSDSTGIAIFSYRGLSTGTDSIVALADSASETAVWTWIGNGPNQPPVVSAGPNQTISLPNTTLRLVGSVVDDGLPVGGTLSEQWSQLSGPATASLSSPSQAVTQASFMQAGTYVLQLTANDSQLSSSATTTITVLPQNQPPVVNAGPDQLVPFVPSFQQTASLNGSASDDGLPVGSNLSLKWSQVRGESLATIASPTAAKTSIVLPAAGTYIFGLSASDGQFTTTSYTTVTAAPPVVVTPATAQGSSWPTASWMARLSVLGSDRAERDARAGSDSTTGPRTLFPPDDADILRTVGRRIAAACGCQTGASDDAYLRPSCASDAPKRGVGLLND
jgi:Bacterial Ig-like domain (group 1)